MFALAAKELQMEPQHEVDEESQLEGDEACMHHACSQISESRLHSILPEHALCSAIKVEQFSEET
eukprot:4405420-Amphidinium_carterae.1